MRKFRIHIELPLLVLLAIFSNGSAAALTLFSADAASSGVSSDADVLAPGAGPPAVFATRGSLGLAVPGVEDLNALSYGAPIGSTMYFSVDRTSSGGPGTDVSSQATLGQAAGDVFSTTLSGTNSLFLNQDELGLPPLVGSGVSVASSIANLDALDLEQSGSALINYFTPAGPPLFSLPTGNVFGLSGADILAPGASPSGPPVVVISATSGGSAGYLHISAGDDVDAFHIDSVTGQLLFSLAPGSPGLGGGGACHGTSAADIFVATPTDCEVYASAESLGLLPTDNVTAIAFTVVPEPSSALLIAIGLAALGWRGRGRSS